MNNLPIILSVSSREQLDTLVLFGFPSELLIIRKICFLSLLCAVIFGLIASSLLYLAFVLPFWFVREILVYLGFCLWVVLLDIGVCTLHLIINEFFLAFRHQWSKHFTLKDRTLIFVCRYFLLIYYFAITYNYLFMQSKLVPSSCFYICQFIIEFIVQ